MHAVFTCILDIIYIKPDVDITSIGFDIRTVICLVMLIYTSMIFCCVGGLTCYHSRLACLGLTTNEEMRGKFTAMSSNPYDNGCH